MKLKCFSLLILFAGLLFLASGVVIPIVLLQIYTSQNGAVAIIGGADGPTALFLTFKLMEGRIICSLVFGITLIISGLFCLIFSKTIKNNCNIKTSALSLGLSAIGAAGLVCAFLWFTIVSFGEMSKHPIEYPISVLLGIFCFFTFIVLSAVYLKLRKINWSIKGLIIDILTSITYLPAFFFLFLCLYEVLT